MKKILALACLVVFMAAGLAVASEPIQLSLTPDIAIHSKTTRIEGLSLNIWGENPQSSFALGIVNGFTGSSKGFSLGLLLSYADNYKGFQLGCVNYIKGTMLGGHMGFVNYVESSVKGVQVGGVNYAGHLNGLQLGFVNYAASATTGVQIGVLNLIPKNQWFSAFPDQVAPGMVIVNWRF
jgi:hypothetical protein